MEINMSTANMWPFAAYNSTGALQRYSERITGIPGIRLEVLPSRRVLSELRNNSALTARPETLGSLHDTWAADTPRDRKFGRGRWSVDTLLRSSLFFPPNDEARQALSALGKAYQLTTVFHWQEDDTLVHNPALEIHGYIGRIKPSDTVWNPRQIIDWVSKGDNKTEGLRRSLVLDTSDRKWGEYCNTANINESERLRTAKQLLAHASLLHFQIGNTDEMKVVFQQNTDTLTGLITREAKRLHLPITLEINIIKSALMGKISPSTVFRKAIEFINAA